MPPKDSPFFFDEEMDSVPEPKNNGEGELHNYQITYENPRGDQVTCVIGATFVITDGDLYEFWYGEVLAFATASETVIEVLNISLMLSETEQ